MHAVSAFVAALGLAAASLVVGAPAHAAPHGEAGPPATLGDIAIVPLDDRPFTAVAPAEMARAGGHTALTPDVGLLGEFFTYGDAEAVGEWWRSSAEDAVGSIVAIPMLAYGGLVASRSCDTDVETALERLRVLQEVKTAHPDQPVFAFDVIQRLTIEPTSGYPGKYSGAVRRWAELMDQVENLGDESLRAAYEEVAAAIPLEIREDYLCARTRNHEVNLAMVRAAAAGTLDFLVLGQDDAGGYGPHRAEKEQLTALIGELGVGDRVKVYPGADVLSALLTAKLVIERLQVAPTVAVEWSRTPGDDWTAPYQDVTYGHLVGEYIRTLGASPAAAADSDVLLMANTSGPGSLEPFVDRIQEAVSHGRLVAVGDDAVAGTVDPELRRLLLPRIDAGELAGWSGWNVGISLAQAVVRSAFLDASRAAPLLAGDLKTVGTPVLEQRRALLSQAAQAHQRLLFEELVHTDLYRNNVRASVREYAASRGDDPQYMTDAFDGANTLAVESTRILAEALFRDEFDGAPLRLGSDGQQELTAEVSSLSGLEMRLGWPRYQELDVFPQIQLEPGNPSSAVSVALLPAAKGIRPDAEVAVDLLSVIRNNTAEVSEVSVSLQAPSGWSAPEASLVRLKPFEVVDVPLTLTTAPTTAGSSQSVTITVASAGGAEASATSVLTAAWRNVALASGGATATASGYWNQYVPSRAIDGNTAGSASRWISPPVMPQWLEVTLPRVEPVDTVALHQYGGYELQDFAVSVLVDGDWVEVGRRVDNVEARAVVSFPAVETTAIRLDVSRTRDGQARLYELEGTCRSSALCD